MRQFVPPRYARGMNIKHLLLACAVAAAVTVGGFQLANAQSVDNHALANQLAAKFVAAQNTQNVELLNDIFPENYIQHNPDVPPGLAGVKKLFAAQFAQIKAQHVPVTVTIESVAVDGDLVVLRSLTKYKSPSKGKWMQARSIDEWRIIGGKLGEHWDSDSAPHPADK
jgi:predicted SnoaL-like aldol condensation-catalyzing enzyme